MIKIENLCKKFDDFEVLKNVSLSLEEGKSCGFDWAFRFWKINIFKMY